MLARSFAANFRAPLDAAHGHDNHLLTSPALESVLAPDQPNDNGIQRAAAEVMITTPTLAAPPTRRLARRRAAVTCVMRTAMTRRPTSNVALRHGTTLDTTQSDRQGGGPGREGRRVDGGRAGVHACARAVL